MKAYCLRDMDASHETKLESDVSEEPCNPL